MTNNYKITVRTYIQTTNKYYSYSNAIWYYGEISMNEQANVKNI